MISKIVKDLHDKARSEKAAILQRFFKTAKGEYGEGDVFLGCTAPDCRIVVRKYSRAPLPVVQKLMMSKIHEHRLVGVLILVEQFKRSHASTRKTIFDFYLKNARAVNNWDLVDLSAPHIGQYLFDKDVRVLSKLAQSKNLWERRIAIMFTFAFIRQNRFNETLRIAEFLLSDAHDLIHKAVGWMLREVGKRDLEAEEKFLKKHYKKMPATMLRYAVEKFSEKKRKAYLKRLI